MPSSSFSFSLCSLLPLEFTVKAKYSFIIWMLALISPSEQDSLIRCKRKNVRPKERNVCFLRVIKNSPPRAPIAFSTLKILFCSSFFLFIIDTWRERWKRFIVIENWIDKIYMFTDEIFRDIHNVDNKTKKMCASLKTLNNFCAESKNYLWVFALSTIGREK